MIYAGRLNRLHRAYHSMSEIIGGSKALGTALAGALLLSAMTLAGPAMAADSGVSCTSTPIGQVTKVKSDLDPLLVQDGAGQTQMIDRKDIDTALKSGAIDIRGQRNGNVAMCIDNKLVWASKDLFETKISAAMNQEDPAMRERVRKLCSEFAQNKQPTHAVRMGLDKDKIAACCKNVDQCKL